MRYRNSIVDDLRKVRERIGRAHGFDVDRIAATIRKHEPEASVTTAPTAPRRRRAWLWAVVGRRPGHSFGLPVLDDE